jgi:DNA-binding GntR family transcriptional regulator
MRPVRHSKRKSASVGSAFLLGLGLEPVAVECAVDRAIEEQFEQFEQFRQRLRRAAGARQPLRRRFGFKAPRSCSTRAPWRQGCA